MCCYKFYHPNLLNKQIIPAAARAATISSSLTRTFRTNIQPPDTSHMTTASLSSSAYNFASSNYKKTFQNLPSVDVPKLRESAISYIKEFNPQTWFAEPVVTILKGTKLYSSESHDTIDAFGTKNGMIQYATPAQVSQLLQHIQSYESPYKDLRDKIRTIEALLQTKYSGFLIGNQAMDFWKQDGVTEMEESIMANEVERRMNDALLEDELDAKKIKINRHVAFVGCVSNFSNFLDLFRKILRNLECGVPVIILSRSNTTQHSFRYTELLVELLKEHEIDLGMITYASCEIDDIKALLKAATSSPMYITCSRDLARTIKSNHDKTIASTGGPNTLVSTTSIMEKNENNNSFQKLKEAIALSATIESSGQCTALRHLVLPTSISKEFLQELFYSQNEQQRKTASKEDIIQGLQEASFAGIFQSPSNSSLQQQQQVHVQHDSSYIKLDENNDIFYRINDVDTFPSTQDLNEYWRNVVLDISTCNITNSHSSNSSNLNKLAMWLIQHQPISLAINISNRSEYPIAKQLWERTSLVVTTVGLTNDSPSLTCQARPQEAEIFGEFPVRKELSQFTKFPVIVPSSTPSYDSFYQDDYLKNSSTTYLHSHIFKKEGLKELLDLVQKDAVRGYCVEIINYLVDSLGDNASVPNVNYGISRTALWGLQRPPLLNCQKTFIFLNPDTTSSSCNIFDLLLPTLLPFLLTNAKNQICLIYSEPHTLPTSITDHIQVAKVTESNYESSCYNIIHLNHVADEFPMIGHFISLLFPLGHLKSTLPNDKEFVKFFSASEKWLRLNDTF